DRLECTATERNYVSEMKTDDPSAVILAASSPVEMPAPLAAHSPYAQRVLIVLGIVAFLYFARPVVLPVFLACVAGMTVKPLIRWLSRCRIPPAISSAVVLAVLVSGIIIGFIQLGQPALTWVNEAPQHMIELRQ